ncbi:G8 domain-containing protein [Deinococcus sp.]|uniref:G8 domain-containing protein n=1 Tax=Deinococcus sp. TaxID=47478 RepID=UPI003B5D045C
MTPPAPLALLGLALLLSACSQPTAAVVQEASVVPGHDHLSADHLSADHLSAQAVTTMPSMAAMPGDHVAMLASTFKWNVVASQSGNWNEPGTWQAGRVPGDGDNVRIPQGLTVSVNSRESAALARIDVEGTLSFATNTDTRLIVDTMLVTSPATVTMGTSTQPLRAGVTAELIVQSRPEAPLNVAEKTRGILASGRFITNGPDKAHMAALTGDARRGSNSLQFKNAPAGWAVGDEVVVTGTRFHWANSQNETLLENEVRKITAINGSTVTLDAGLIYDHVRADASFSIFVSNLTRPIVIRSANPKPLTERGHVMFMKGSQVDIRDAAFIDLGRTDKASAITASNLRGVYSLHFHQNGYDHEQHVSDSVIRGTPGWGLVNHSSDVVASNNVVHDFAGSAFVAEAGDEIGSFTGNIVSGGTNRPLQAKPYAREAIGAESRQRLLAGDMGKFANGFWMVSPQVVVQNNVVAGGNGTAYLMFTLGTVEFGPDNPTVGQFTGFPLDRVPAGIIPRTWNYPNQFTGATMAVTADLPIKDFRNNVAYGVFQGLRVRWNNDGAGFMFNGGKGVDVARLQTTPKNLTRQRHLLRDLTFWNVGSGMNVGYSENYDVDNLTVVNASDYDPGCNERFCGAYGFSTDGGGGMDARISNSRISGGKTAPLDLASEMSTKNLFIDGKLYTKQ